MGDGMKNAPHPLPLLAVVSVFAGAETLSGHAVRRNVPDVTLVPLPVARGWIEVADEGARARE
jgi:hypothetical protein